MKLSERGLYIAANQESKLPDLPVSEIVEESLPSESLGNRIATVSSDASENNRNFVIGEEWAP